jgi:hypothetical protein
VYNEWFSFDENKPGKVFKIKENTVFHNDFKKDYEQKTDTPLIPFKRIRTRLLWLSGPVVTSNLNEGTLTGLWEIRR